MQMWFFLLQLLIQSPGTLWSDSFSDDNWTSNPEWYLRVGDANVGGPNKLLFLYGDANSTAKIGTTGDGEHENNFYMTFKTKIFNNPSSNTEREWLIVKADTLISYSVVFDPAKDKIYIWNGSTYIDSASSDNIPLGSLFYAALKVINNNIYVACSLQAFTSPPPNWGLIYTEAIVDPTIISDTLWIGGWDIDSGTSRGLMFDDIVVQTPDAGIEETHIANPILSLSGYPNPFSKKTVIRYSLSKTTDINDLKLTIYDFLGRLIREIPIDNQNKNNKVSWDGKDESGKEIASGIYYCTLKSGRYIKSLKLVLIR